MICPLLFEKWMKSLYESLCHMSSLHAQHLTTFHINQSAVKSFPAAVKLSSNYFPTVHTCTFYSWVFCIVIDLKASNHNWFCHYYEQFVKPGYRDYNTYNIGISCIRKCAWWFAICSLCGCQISCSRIYGIPFKFLTQYYCSIGQNFLHALGIS